MRRLASRFTAATEHVDRIAQCVEAADAAVPGAAPVQFPLSPFWSASMRGTVQRSLFTTLCFSMGALVACGGDARSSAGDSTARPAGGAASSASAATSSGADLTGAGSTFAYPLYSRWAADYARAAGVKVNYQSIGSGGGIRQFSEMTVDFGGTDAPMTDDQLARAKGGPVLHVPTAMGGVVLTYNLPQLSQPLKMTPDVIADIFLGKITRWNDRRLAALNPGVMLPSQDMLVVHRSDGSGTTYVWTDYLSTVSPAWAKGPGKGTDVQWPVGLGGKGNEGVAGQVRQSPGAIGYVELAYAKQNQLPAALVRNAAGNFVAPSVESITAAAAGMAAALPSNTDYRISIVNAPGKDAYPISSMTWIILYTHQQNPGKGRKLIDFLRWALTEGQQVEPSLDYAPLPETMTKRLLQRLDAVTVASAR
jgi:phosphate transport system substrate-binding protein